MLLLPEILSTDFLSHSASTLPSSLLALDGSLINSIPFAELGKQLSESLDIGNNLSRAVGRIPEYTTSIVLESLGYDLLVFLAASVFVTLICRFINITPILGYLVVGAILGPHGLDVFANSKADVELGDFGILFLLFSEGLDVSKPRLAKLANFLPLGLAQISLVTGVITACFLSGVPEFIGSIVPLNAALIDNIGHPVEAVVLAFAAALSTSAFIFPVLKERQWEDEESGEAATSILLLQDLMVAPVLVLLPYLVGDTKTDYAAIGFLTAKATLGFGTIMYCASFILQKLFTLVAQTQSTETFVALCLLVSAGMGSVAKFLGLTDTAGAFAAGVLLANTNYRAQIQADVLPFKGILLGIFFMDAGSTFDLNLVVSEWPTILVGAAGLLVIKAITLGLATRIPRRFEPNRLKLADGIRVSLLLSGGGEFAFVVLATAEKLTVIPSDLSTILTTIVLITMGATPLLGQAAAALSERFLDFPEESHPSHHRSNLLLETAATSFNGTPTIPVPSPVVAEDAVVVCGYGEIGRSLVQALSVEMSTLKKKISSAGTLAATSNGNYNDNDEVDRPSVSIVAFDTAPELVNSVLVPNADTFVFFGNGANAEVIRSSGITHPAAIFVSYEDHSRALSATVRLRTSFPNTPIYARAATRAEVGSLETAGATEVVVESDELPRAAASLVRGVWGGNLAGAEYAADKEQVRLAASLAAGLPLGKVDQLLELFAGMDQDGSGLVSVEELENVLDRSTNWIATDDEIAQFNAWIDGALEDNGPLDAIEFCRLYGRAPYFVKRAFGVSRETQEKTK
jgi:Kef-type K+ transport system membrane component KefB/voltage-gated potassium channel Kch